MKKAIVILAALGVAAVVLYFWRPWRGKSVAEADKPKTAKVERGPIVVSIAATGRVVANLDVDIKCKASGEITKLPYDVSDPVKKDVVLMELDPIDQQRILKQTEASLAASQARLASAKQNLAIARLTLGTDRARAGVALKAAEARAADTRAKADRAAQLLGQKLLSQEEADTVQTNAVQAAADFDNAKVRLEEIKTQEQALELRRQEVKLAEAQVESDTVAREVAQDRLADTKVVAPMDGVISARNVQMGQIISSAISNVGGGTTVLTLSDLTHIYVLASVDESDIGKVQVGQRARATADAFRGKTFRGEVVRIATKGVNASNVVTFEVKIEITGENKGLLKPEMTANVEIVNAEKQGVLVVPAEAITRKDGKFSATVVKAGGATEERPIEVGISDGVRTEVASGLQEGEAVALRKSGADSRWNAGQPRPGGMLFPTGGPRGR